MWPVLSCCFPTETVACSLLVTNIIPMGHKVDVQPGTLALSLQGLAIIGTGLSIGLLTAVAAGRLVGEFLVGIGPADPVTYITVSMLLSLIALAACYIPARRAMQVEPTVALRYE
jgi:hypothetical protein